MTQEEQMSRFIINIRPYLKSKIKTNELKNVTEEQVDRMSISFHKNQKGELRPFIDEKIVNKLTKKMTNDYGTIWSSGRLDRDLLR